MLPFLDSLSDQDASELAFIDANKHWTWNDLLREKREVAAQLSGLEPGASVVLVTPDRASTVPVMIAALESRVSVTLVSVNYGTDYARGVAKDSAASATIEWQDGRPVVNRCDADGRSAAAAGDPTIGILTSGTTGLPKVGRYTWNALGKLIKVDERFRQKRWLLRSPISHLGGLVQLAQSLVNRGTLVFTESFAVEPALRALIDHGVDYLTCTPTYLRQILMLGSAADLEKIKLARITLIGEISDQNLLDRAVAAIPRVKLTHRYGTTELGPLIEVRDGKEGFDAALLDGKTLKLHLGRLWAKRNGTSTVDARSGDEWVDTGDLIEVSGGRARFLGRASEEINVGGEKVNPAVVEKVIQTVVGVQHVNVVAHASPITGQLVKAIVWTATDCDKSDLRSRIVSQCSSQLAPHMVPRVFEFQNELQLTASGKMQRRP